MKRTYDAVVLGAGIIGAACALECAKAGMRTAIVERDRVASGATGAAMGHVVVMDDSPAQFALTKYSQTLWSELAGELPASAEYYQPGTIWVAADEEEMAELRRKLAFFSAHGVPAELLDSQSLADAEPNLLQALSGGLRVSSDAVLYPPAATAFLLEQAQQQPARLELFENHPVMQASHGTVVLQDGDSFHSSIIINATGVYAPALTPGIAIRKRKGHLMITESCPRFARHQLVELGYLKSAHSSTADSVAFNVQPRMNGQLLIGSSRQYDEEDSAVEPRMIEWIKERASLFMPGVTSLPIARSWTGFRAATPDKLPLIGPTEDSSIFLATGHEGLGITTSLATARLLLNHIMGNASAIPIDTYLPSRMAR